MDLILLGPGRAGVAVSLAAKAAGHGVVGVAGRDRAAAADAAASLGSPVLDWEDALPSADVVIVAVRDGAISEVAGRYAGKAAEVGGAAHLSGLVATAALDPMGIPTASFHPLQTMPTAEAGAERLAGSWIGVTSDDDYLADRLFELAASIGARPFELADAAKPLYHAAAAAAANYTLAALAVSRRLFEAAGVPFESAHPLIRAVVDNAVELGPDDALTGPIARGDVETVRAQVEAIRSSLPELAEAFEAMARATAGVAGAGGSIEDALR
jgi:predicted short-subunit dehydrogenase-like oxidoreductase (DUF2520 family)